MKRVVILSCLLAVQAVAQAQGTFEFAAHLTNDVYSSEASFTLTDMSFHYRVDTVGLEVAQIRGPGTPDSNAPVIFNLTLVGCDPPLPGGIPGDCYFSGIVTLTSDQISELLARQWYVDSYSPARPFLAPMRGQIEPIPEPSMLALAFFGTAALVILRHRPLLRSPQRFASAVYRD